MEHLSPRPYEVTLISADVRTSQTVLAHSSMQALRTALNVFPEQGRSCALLCKPLGQLTEPEAEPCAA
jgi:hypothetical protein